MGIAVEWFAVLRTDVAERRLSRSRVYASKDGLVGGMPFRVQQMVANEEYGKPLAPVRIKCESWFDAVKEACIKLKCDPGEVNVQRLDQWKKDNKAVTVSVPVIRRAVPPLTKKGRTK